MLDVLIAEDNITSSVHLCNAINSSNVRCVGILNDGINVYKKTKELNPDVLLLDLKMPSKDGLNILEEIQEDKALNTRIFIYSGETEYIALARKYKCVNRFFSKLTPPEEISRELEEASEEIYNKNTENKVIEILLKLGFSYALRGTRLLDSCIMYSINEDEDNLNNIYEIIAQRTGENAHTTKSNISTAINNMWKHTERSRTRRILRLGEHEKPSAKIIIAMVKYYIQK